MTSRTSFNEGEWLLLGDAPLAAAAAVALADQGGGRQEAAAIVGGWREAAREHGSSELLGALAADLDPEEREQREGRKAEPAAPPDFDALCDEAVGLCLRAVELLEERATPEEADDYRAFVMHIVRRVAAAAGEGGLFGGERVSRGERSVIREIAAALRFRG